MYLKSFKNIIIKNNLAIVSKSPEETYEIGHQLAKELKPPIILILEGTLGTGKTLLVKGIGKGLNIKEEIVSPTFTILNQYKTDSFILNHFDLYRINNFEELYFIGIEDFLQDNNSINVFEWGEEFLEYFKEYKIKIIKIKIEILNNLSRKLFITLNN